MKILFVFFFLSFNCFCQNLTGFVKVTNSNIAIPNATIGVIQNKGELLISFPSDSLGFFKYSSLKVGRYTVMVSYTGFKPLKMEEILIISGKDTNLEFYLEEDLNQLEEVTVKAKSNQNNLLSNNKLNIEQTSRFAATWGDPARMALSFAGVSNVKDGNNDLVIRGNSPKGMLWKIEGIEVPNPNHFSADGATGGSISALNSNVLGNSNFYTGAFPAQYGNATSGVFDIDLRSGNKEKYENSLSVGLLGIDASSEGYLIKGKMSYLVNYRFTNTTFIKKFGLNSVIGTATPKYEDLVFKLSLNNKKTDYSVWGLFGRNTADFTLNSFAKFENFGNFFMMGFKSKTQLNANLSLETHLFQSNSKLVDSKIDLTPRQDNKFLQSNKKSIRFSYEIKFNKTKFSNFRFGQILSNLNYKVNGYSEFVFPDINLEIKDISLNSTGNAFFLQSFINWNKKSVNSELNLGLHNSYFYLNGKNSLEPRLQYRINSSSFSSFQIGMGLHSRLEPISIYMFKESELLNAKKVNNVNLKIPKSMHFVLGYSWNETKIWRFHSEIYWQELYHIPIADTTFYKSTVSLINTTNSINLLPLISNGKGRNKGLELTIERPLNLGYYFLMTTSVFKSTYDFYDKNNLPTQYDNRFIFNLLGGKEWVLKNNILSLNIRNTWAGGKRVLPYKLVQNKPVFDYNNGFTAKTPNYFKIDLKLNYMLNFKNTTSTFSLDFNNLTDRKNPYTVFFNPISNQFESINQLGFLPVFIYKFQF
jgi:Carboxypeptidase regulatory-like domain